MSAEARIVDALPEVFHVRRVPGARRGVVFVHGVMSHAGWFERLSSALAEQGISSIAVDRRGSGSARGMDGVLDSRAWIDDVRSAQAYLRERGAQVAVVGWCWGARLAVVAATVDPPDQLILVAPGLAMAPLVRARAAALATTTEDPAPLPFGPELFSSRPEILRWITDDPLAWHDQPRAFQATSRGLLDQALSVLPTLTVPLATILADADRIIDNAGVEKLVATHPIIRVPGEHALVLESPGAVARELIALLVS